MYGPKGVGALYVRRQKPRVRIVAQMDGGGHERGMRSGTLNVPGIVGFGKAAEIMLKEWRDESRAHLRACASACARSSIDALDEVHLNGSLEHRAAGQPQRLVRLRRGRGDDDGHQGRRRVARGSACTQREPRAELRAARAWASAKSSRTRRSASASARFNTEEEVDYVADLVIDKVKRLREMSPLYEMHKEGIDLKSVQWAAH